MADQFSKDTILNKLKAKVQAKGFNVDVSSDELATGTPTILDLLDIIAGSLADVFFIDEDKDGSIKADKLNIGPDGQQQPHSFKEAEVRYDATTDPAFFTWLETFHAILQGVYPEPGNGSPNNFASAMKTLLSQKPSSVTGKIVEGSDTVKVTT